MAFCGNCGASMGDNDKFCGKCGAASAAGAAIKAPLSIDPKYSGMAPKMTSALPSGDAPVSASAPAGKGPASKMTTALPSGEAFGPVPSAPPSGGMASKMTSPLPSGEAFGPAPSAPPSGGMAPKMTSPLPAEQAAAAGKGVPSGADEVTVALLNVSKRPGYEASNAYLDGKDSAAGGNPFGGSASTPFGRPGSGAGSEKSGGPGGLPVFGAGAAASAAFASGSQAGADAPDGYPFGDSKSGLGPKSSELGPFKGGPIEKPDGLISVRTAEEEPRQTPSVIQQSGGAIVGNVKNETAVTAAPASSVAVEDNVDDINDYLWISLGVAFLCCCPITGLIAIICSYMCRTKKQAGDIVGAVQMSSYAKMANMAGLIFTLLCAIALVLFCFLNS